MSGEFNTTTTPHKGNALGYIVVLVIIIVVGWFIFSANGGTPSSGETNNEDTLTKAEIMTMIAPVENGEKIFTEEEKAVIFQTIGGSGLIDLGVTEAEQERIINALNKTE